MGIQLPDLVENIVGKREIARYEQMGIQLPDLIENIVGKREIARYEQFLPFPQCFQKLSVVDVYLWSKELSLGGTNDFNYGQKS